MLPLDIDKLQNPFILKQSFFFGPTCACTLEIELQGQVPQYDPGPQRVVADSGPGTGGIQQGG